MSVLAGFFTPVTYMSMNSPLFIVATGVAPKVATILESAPLVGLKRLRLSVRATVVGQYVVPLP